jgi:hypothetical protein
MNKVRIYTDRTKLSPQQRTSYRHANDAFFDTEIRTSDITKADLDAIQAIDNVTRDPNTGVFKNPYTVIPNIFCLSTGCKTAITTITFEYYQPKEHVYGAEKRLPHC